MSANDRPISLEARMDAQLRSFGYGYQNEEQTGSSLPRKAVQGAAGAAIGAGGFAAYKNREALATAGKDAARKGLKKTASFAGQTSNSLHKTALKSAGMKMQAAGAGSNLLQKASTGLRKVAKSFSRADIDQVLHLAERIALLELEAEEEEDGVIEFAAPVRSVTKLMKTSKLNPLAIRKTGMVGEFRVAAKGAAKSGPLGYYTDDIRDARGTAADLLRRKRAGQEVGFESALGFHEFADTEQRSKLGVGIAGAAGGNYINAIPAMRAQDRFEKAGHVYRKRDAVKDSLKGSAVGGATSVGLFGAGLGGAAALGTLAAKRKLPKGILRKAGVKAGKAFRGMNTEKLMRVGQATGLAGLGAGFYAQGKFADKRLAKRQAEA
jgi:hypothetical protein